ncbi:protein of unknown function DUF507 [Candidatus Magnetoovum chiemensis]|nr:protein of unknown function DUF507 [Candidatus Magnetoovum chiemensis]
MPIIAKDIITVLLDKGLIEERLPTEKLISVTEELILEELMAEDRLNDEVREILKSYESEIERKRLDYRDLFEMTKRKLIKERNIVI